MLQKLLFGLLVVSQACLAQIDSTSNDSTADIRASYVKRFPDHFWVWPVTKTRSLEFETNNLITNERTRFKPNSRTSLGVGFYLFELAAEVAFSVPESQQSIDQFGETDVRDFQINAIGKFWGVDAYWQRYKGFYLTNPELPVPLVFPRRADIESRNFGLSGFYAFNRKKFSLRSAYNFSERQLQSGGSWMLIGTLNSFRMEGDSVLGGSDPGSRFLTLRYTTFGLAPGYSYNYIYRKFFINGTLGLGPAHNWTYVQEPTGRETNNITINSYAILRVGLGYNSDRFFGGVGFVIQSRNLRVDDVRFTNSTSVVRVMMGYRFREFGILKKRAVDLLNIFR